MSPNVLRFVTAGLFVLCAVVEYFSDDFDWRKALLWVAIAFMFFVSLPPSERRKS